MEHNIPWERFQHYLKHPYESYDSDFESWLQALETNQKLWDEVKLTYLLTGDVPESFEPNQKQAWNKIEKRIDKPVKRIRLNPVWLQVAASFLLFTIGALSSWYFLTPAGGQYAEVYSPYGHKTRVVLPDQSVVWLNGNSLLRYPADFSESRKLELTGEALFEVTKDPDKVFNLHSGDVRVEVYGTKFNFKHYAEDEQAEVALIEGSVGLFRRDKLLTTMKPGQLASYDLKSEQLKLEQERLDIVTSWNSDELIIENQPLGEVLKYLERWYGVEFSLSAGFKPEQQLSFKVKSESLPELLSTISRITPLRYTIDGKKIQLSN
ncbi:MAG: FecR domain-containing protein [Mangrovibacterium sp.]